MARSAAADKPPGMTNELALAVECCRWCFAVGEPSPIEQLAAAVRWDRLVKVSRRQRVEGLVWHCLRSLAVPVPAVTEQALAGDAAEVAQHNLRAVRQSALLLETFTSAGIPLIFIKGLSLGKLAYGDAFLKTSRDIDTLVPAEAIAAAAAELERLGYSMTLPQSGQLERWHRKRKESVWRSPDGLYLELHSRLADSPELIPGIGIGSPRQGVEVAPGIVLPTLAADELFAYLCVHGASSAWFRLKWIADLAALLSGCTVAEIERLYERSQQLGAGRAPAQALLLAAKTFGTAAGSDLERSLDRTPVNRWLADSAWKQMVRKDEPTAIRLGTAMIHLTQLFLRPGMRFKLREASRQLSDLGSRVP